MKFQILKKSDLLETREFSDGNYKIGRGEGSDIVLNSPQVSKNHALLVIKDNRAAIVDVGSSNGVFVNGILVKKQRIREGDEVVIVDFRLKIADGKAHEAQIPRQSGSSQPAHFDPPVQRTQQEKLLLFVDQKILSPLYLLMQKS